MQLRITSITSSEVGALISGITTVLEDRLCPIIEPNQYGTGIDLFVAFFVSVDSDPMENERYCFANNRSGRFKHMLTGETVRFVGIAVPVDPEIVLKHPSGKLSSLLQELFLEELASPAYVMPKRFERERLWHDISTALKGN